MPPLLSLLSHGRFLRVASSSSRLQHHQLHKFAAAAATFPGAAAGHQQQHPYQNQNHINNSTTQRQQKRSFHFGTKEYAASFENLPQPDTVWLRQTAIDYLNDDFDAQRWYDDPIVSMVNGQALSDDSNDSSSSRVVQETKNALGQVNGRQILASQTDLQRIRQHIGSYHHAAWQASTDLRDIVRQIEEDLFTLHSGFLIGNQCVDFQKQDGITELQEAIQANVIERRLNDQLLQQEEAGILDIYRKPIYVSTVSNFTNFLDLSRKTLRSLEVGIPVIILSRSNTSQHSFRWTQKLIELGAQHGLDAGMITYISASLEDIVSLTQSTSRDDSTGNLYATCSRSLARAMNASYNNNANSNSNYSGKVIASTGGPNTLILTTDFSVRAASVQAHYTNRESEKLKQKRQKELDSDDEEQDDDETNKTKKKKWHHFVNNAIRTSATIESSGQCTALRHAVVPLQTTMEHLHLVFAKGAVTLLSPPMSNSGNSNSGTTTAVGGAPEALQKRQFDAVFAKHTGSANPPTKEYHYNASADAYYKLSDTLPASGIPAIRGSDDDDDDKDGLPEYWRKVVVDFTKLDVSRNPVHFDQLVTWLNENQPISLAINGPRQEAYQLALKLFERTALVVYTVGSTDDVENMPPALTCQARPQDGEIFGEFPPRSALRRFTKFPVIVPSSNPSYDATYRLEYLQQLGARDGEFGKASPYFSKKTRILLEHVQDDAIRGYCVVLLRYLQNVDQKNPKLGFAQGNRTCLWGLQRLPLGSKTFVHVAADTPWDAIAPLYTLFHVTTARDQIELSIHPPNAEDNNDNNEALIALCHECKLAHTVETMDEMTERLQNRTDVFAVERISRNDVMKEGFFPMAGQFTSLYLPMGHFKSTMPNDDEFVHRFHVQTYKWINTLF